MQRLAQHDVRFQMFSTYMRTWPMLALQCFGRERTADAAIIGLLGIHDVRHDAPSTANVPPELLHRSWRKALECTSTGCEELPVLVSWIPP